MRAHIRPDSWVPLSLACERSRRISNVHYCLDLRIGAGASTIHGHQHIGFDLGPRHAAHDLLLDWRPRNPRLALEQTRKSLRVNGAASGAPAFSRGHLVVPARHLRAGRNRVEISWTARLGTAGTAITRYIDPVDGHTYIYTLFVPADASSVFPCFDQPDLKARFTLGLTVPRRWNAIANAPIAEVADLEGRQRFQFAPTEPISTYLFAFAAGPFLALDSDHRSDPTRLWVRRSQRQRARPHVEEVLRLNRQAMRYFSHYFGHRFAFAKYDLVLIPEFPYRGMEHAGASFLAEASVLLAGTASAHDRFQRAQLVFHETAHQWLGNLVTMRWFDDLWLKEGFANFMAYKLAARSPLRAQAEVAFHALKASAYETDQTLGASALHPALSDLAAARSVYGSIVYGKAPALLRQAEFMLGPARFRRGVREFVARHAYDAADWRDLVAALERASGVSLQRWANAWILRPGVPRIRAAIRIGRAGNRSTVRITQLAPPTERSAWPLRLDLELVSPGQPSAHAVVNMERRHTTLPLPPAVRQRAWVFVNSSDHAYALTPLGRNDIDAAAAQLARASSPLNRIQIWEALWLAVRDAELEPVRFAELALAYLGDEPNELIVTGVISHLRSALDRMMTPARQHQIAAAVEALLLDGARRTHDAGTKLAWLRGYIEVVCKSVTAARPCFTPSQTPLVPPLNLRLIVIRLTLKRQAEAEERCGGFSPRGIRRNLTKGQSK